MSNVRVLLVVESKLQGEVLQEFLSQELDLAIVGHRCHPVDVLVEIGRRDVGAVIVSSSDLDRTSGSRSVWMDQYPDLVVLTISASQIEVYRNGAAALSVPTDSLNSTLSELRQLFEHGHISQEVSNVVDSVSAAQHPFSLAKVDGSNWSET